ncbi:MAG: hypothetical protein LAO05_10435 [Acidobacteriia bacterium]|nr:hypothetical protein [Terriglobia bacterium]
MSGIGGAAFWDGRPVPDGLAAEMMEAVRHRGPDGWRCETRGSATLGHALLALRRPEREHLGPVWSPDGSRAIVADASLYNRDEVANGLGAGWWREKPSDAALILAAHERWGAAALDVLDGDFAFAIWDEGERQVFAARDAFGMRPLVYHWNPRFILFGSEPKQLLRTRLVPAEPDDQTVAAHLLFRFEESEKTFFRMVSRVRAGHVLVADAAGATQRRWWSPDPRREVLLERPADYHARFRELLKAAVRKRVQVDAPVTCHLSGGVDSASIVVLAGELFAECGPEWPPFSTVSSVYPGLECDESEAIAAVAARVPFEGHLVSPFSEALVEGLEQEIRDLDAPLAFIQRGSAKAEARVLRRIGARVLLTGIGGDEIAEEWAYFYDLALHRCYLRLVRDAWAFRNASSWGFLEILRDSLRASLSLPRLRAVRRILQRPPQLPEWVNPGFTPARALLLQPSGPPAVTFPSRLQQQTFDNVTSPLLDRTLEVFNVQASTHGIEARHPFLDRPLAEFVLGIPYRLRSPGSLRKSLLRRSMGRDLPDTVMVRRRKVVFDSYVRKVIAESRGTLQAMLFGTDRWLAERYVPEARARPLLSAAYRDSSLVAPVFWRVATLELWLRKVIERQAESWSDR